MMPIHPSNPRRGRIPGRRFDAGQSVLELALVLPMLLGLVIGIFEFGRAWNARQVLTNAAREGARHAVIGKYSTTEIDSIVRARLDDASLETGADTVVTITGMGSGLGNPAAVSISYEYTFRFMGPVVNLMNGDDSPYGTITMNTTATMRNESI